MAGGVSPEATPDETLICVRPGASVYLVSADELQVSFPNYTATFVSPAIVRGVTELLHQLREPTLRGDAVAAAAQETGLETSVVEYLVTMMTNANCLYEIMERPRPLTGTDELSEFFAYTGRDPVKTVEALSSARLVVVQGDGGDDIEGVLDQVGLRAEVISAKPGTSITDLVSALREQLHETPRAIACWGIAHRLPQALAVNDLAVETGVPVLFGCSEGVVGRIGPLVLPGTTSCLECMVRRLLGTAGPREATAYAQARLRYADTLPDPWPTHPVWRATILRLFALELANVVSEQPPQTVGGFLEYSYPGGLGRRHPVYRVPGCPSCRAQRPRRFAWDVEQRTPVDTAAAE